MKKFLLLLLSASVLLGQTASNVTTLSSSSTDQTLPQYDGTTGKRVKPTTIPVVANQIPAANASIVDAGDFYTGTDVEAALQQAGAQIAVLNNFNPSPSGNNLVSGGSVAFVSNLSLTVAASSYTIQGVLYNSPITTLTASAADPTFDRIDIVAVNSSGAAVIITGTPAANPVAPDVDPASQLGLTFYILAAGATSIPISVVDIYHNNAEWTMTRSGTTWNLASTNNPYTGSVCIEGTTVATGNSFTATAPGDIDLADHDNLIFYIRNKAAWASTRQISIQWLNNSNVAKGTTVTLKNGTYGFNALTNTTAYQQIAIPLSAFGANGLAVRKLRFQLAGTGGTIGAYVDDITLQGGLAPVVDNTKMQWRGTYNASNLYNVNDVVISSGIQYVAIAPSVGQTPASSATFWQPSSANSGGSVTAVSIAAANGFTGTSTGGATPALTIIAGNITPTSVTTTGIDSSAGAQVEVANALAALAIDVTKGLNTKTIAVDSTFTFSGTPANSNQGFTLRLTNSDTSNHVITIPSTFDTNAQATTTSFTILAGGTETVTWVYNGSTYLGYNIPSPAYSAEITVASATTTNIGAAASVNVAISGTTPITGFGTVAAGTYRQGRFTGILTFTHNASSLILPNAGSNITTAANDRFGAYSLGSGNWLVLWYQRADGTALAGSGGSPGGSSGDYQYNNAGSFGGRTPGTGVNTSFQLPTNATGGLLTFSGAFGTPTSLTLTNATGLPVAGGGTGVATLTTYAPIFGGTTSTGAVQSGTAGTAGQLLRSSGAGVLPGWTTPTYPNTATSGKVLSGDGTNIVLSTPTFPTTASATTRKIIVSDGTNWLASTETYAVPGTSGNVLTSDGTNWTSAAAAGGGTKSLMIWEATRNQPPGTSYATFNTRNGVAVYDFSGSVDTSAVFLGKIPEGITIGTGLRAIVHWVAGTATSGNCVWQTEIEAMTTDMDADSFGTAVTAIGAANGTNGVPTYTNIDHSTGQIDSVVAGNGVRVRVTRLKSNGSDTMTGIAQIVSIELQNR